MAKLLWTQAMEMLLMLQVMVEDSPHQIMEVHLLVQMEEPRLLQAELVVPQELEMEMPKLVTE